MIYKKLYYTKLSTVSINILKFNKTLPITARAKSYVPGKLPITKVFD